MVMGILEQTGAATVLLQRITQSSTLTNSPTAAQLITFASGLVMCLEGMGSTMIVAWWGGHCLPAFSSP